VTNQRIAPISRSLAGKHPNAALDDRRAAVRAKRGSNRGAAVGGKNPENRKAGPG
jgi:hypothetical protein